MISQRYGQSGSGTTGGVQPHMTLSDLLGLVKVVLYDQLPDAYWIVAEIADYKPSPRGWYNLELVQKDGETVVAKIKAVIWRQAAQWALPRFRRATGKDLAAGMTALVKVSVDFHEQFGLQLQIHDVDPSYTIGDMARKKREILERLEREGRLRRNAALALCGLPLRIAIVSSPSAAGYEDFVNQVERNAYGYDFRHSLYSAQMQGAGAEADVLAALARIARERGRHDVIVIIRGGGSSIDLSCFDSYPIAAAIADHPLPIITGIGHERDESVADAVAHTRMKTPTAAAEHLIAIVRAFELRLESVKDRLAAAAERVASDEATRLDGAARRLAHAAVAMTSGQHTRLALAEASVAAGGRRATERAKDRIANAERALRLLNPSNVLRRGYSITYYNGKAVRTASAVPHGASMTTQVYEGEITSTVTNTSNIERSEERA